LHCVYVLYEAGAVLGLKSGSAVESQDRVRKKGRKMNDVLSTTMSEALM
jgi:hypothetical protein